VRSFQRPSQEAPRPHDQDRGHERLGDDAARLRERYAAVDHPMAREVVRWLDGDYAMARWEIET